MTDSTKLDKAKRGPGRPAGQDYPVQVQLRLSEGQAQALDEYRAAQTPSPSRSEAIRRILVSAVGSGPRNVETTTEKIARAKRKIEDNKPQGEPSPQRGMETLRRGLAENELRTLREKKRTRAPSLRNIK